jgi:predicted GH43/DUF377 family glycosyl hydrolase
MNRRAFFRHSAALTGLAAARSFAAAPFRVHRWKRDARNPIFPPGGGAFDARRCMNPFVVTHDGEYWLFYGGADARDRHCICLATCPVDDLAAWKRHGPVIEPGGKGAFDELWTVLPCVHRIGGRWHLYYTGRSADKGAGLQGFRGIGLATSDDLRHWKKVSADPILLGDGFPEWPANKGIAGGAPIIELPQSDGRTLYRLHYTLATGTPSRDLLVDQAKQAVIAHSHDGITWTDRRVVLRPRADAPYENAATIALNVWRTESGWRAIYAGIGTQFGAYSICEAESDDGLAWRRGAPGENLALPPGDAAWESKMTTYPHVVREGAQLRLFYCGNGYGTTGIGTAVAEPLI